MQCKDIADRPILEWLAVHGGIGCTHWWDGISGEARARSVRNAMPAGTPERLALAKLGRLVQRGLIDGCDCGCRGDWELTAKGRDALKPNAGNQPPP